MCCSLRTVIAPESLGAGTEPRPGWFCVFPQRPTSSYSPGSHPPGPSSGLRGRVAESCPPNSLLSVGRHVCKDSERSGPSSLWSLNDESLSDYRGQRSGPVVASAVPCVWWRIEQYQPLFCRNSRFKNMGKNKEKHCKRYKRSTYIYKYILALHWELCLLYSMGILCQLATENVCSDSHLNSWSILQYICWQLFYLRSSVYFSDVFHKSQIQFTEKGCIGVPSEIVLGVLYLFFVPSSMNLRDVSDQRIITAI